MQTGKLIISQKNFGKPTAFKAVCITRTSFEIERV